MKQKKINFEDLKFIKDLKEKMLYYVKYSCYFHIAKFADLIAELKYCYKYNTKNTINKTIYEDFNICTANTFKTELLDFLNSNNFKIED